MEQAKEGQAYQNPLQMEDASRAQENASTLHSVESMPVKARGGVVQEEYDHLLGNAWNELSNEDTWLTYPEGERDAVEITSNDFKSVQPRGLLSGNIIDFYTKYLWEKLCGISKDRLHFFNSFFFTQLANNGGVSTESGQRKNAFEKVQKWTGEVNIFEKAWVFIPVNQSPKLSSCGEFLLKCSSHWSLIVIYNLTSLTSSPDEHDCPPCIFHLDSVEGKHGNLEGHIRSYIIHAWKERYCDPSVDQLLALSQMKYIESQVPQQDNHYDCGIYLLHLVELFLFGLQDLKTQVPCQGTFFFVFWDAFEVSAKRREIRDLILERSLASRRKSQEHQKLISRQFQLRSVSDISEVLGPHLDGNESPPVGDSQNNDLKQPNAGVDESEHADRQTTGDVAHDDQHYSEIEHKCNQTTGEIMLDDQQQQGEEVECADLKPVKGRSKRYRNWSKDETSVLLYCKKEGGRFWKKRKQGTTDWIAISEEIENKLGTTPSGDQCRLRYDTLLKAYKSSKDYCMRTGKPFSEELCQSELKLATNLSEDWYNAMDEICRCSSQKARSLKRVKEDQQGGGLVSVNPFNSPYCNPLIQYPTESAEQVGSGKPESLLSGVLRESFLRKEFDNAETFPTLRIRIPVHRMLGTSGSAEQFYAFISRVNTR